MKRNLLRVVSVLLALALAAAAAGCGGDDEDHPIRVGLVTDTGGLNDHGFNSLANKGLEDAEAQLDVQGRVLESKTASDYGRNLSELGEQGYDLIISVGFRMTDATAKAAKAFPDSNFAIVDSAFDPPIANAEGILFSEQQAGCLVGVAGALMSKSRTISTVGGEKIPPVDRFIAGYRACAKKARPDIELLNAYSQDFVDKAKCRRIALDQIAQGSDVVFQVAGVCGLGALDGAKQQGVWGIGVDADQAYLGDHILTSALKRVDVAVFKTIEADADGSFAGGDVTTFGLAEDGVGLGRTSPDVPQEVLDKVDEFRRRIVDGELTLPKNVK